MGHTVPGVDKIEGAQDLPIGQMQIGQCTTRHLLGGHLLIHEADSMSCFQQFLNHSEAAALQYRGDGLGRAAGLKESVFQNGAGA